MKNIIKGQVVVLVSLLAALTVTLAACGGGGSSSAGGSAAIRASTMVVGTVAGGGTASVEFGGAVRMVAALGDLMIETARADDPVTVVVICGINEYTGSTNEAGWFEIAVNEAEPAECTTTFNGLAGPSVNVTPGMRTEINVSVAGGSVVEVSAPVQTETGTTSVAGTADDGSSDGISDSISDDLSSDDLSSDDLSSDDLSSDDLSSDDLSEDSTSEDGNSRS